MDLTPHSIESAHPLEPSCTPPRHLTPDNKKICTPYAARVCICIGITSTFHREALGLQWFQGFFVPYGISVSL